MKRVVWEEPWPGEDSNGPCTVPMRCSMATEDAVKVARRAVVLMRPDLPIPSEKDLLEEFITVHWAWLEEIKDL